MTSPREFLALSTATGVALGLAVWLPSRADKAGFASMRVQRALDRGLTFRSRADMTTATLGWFKARPPERQVSLTPEREKAVITAWEAPATIS